MSYLIPVFHQKSWVLQFFLILQFFPICSSGGTLTISNLRWRCGIDSFPRRASSRWWPSTHSMCDIILNHVWHHHQVAHGQDNNCEISVHGKTSLLDFHVNCAGRTCSWEWQEFTHRGSRIVDRGDDKGRISIPKMDEFLEKFQTASFSEIILRMGSKRMLSASDIWIMVWERSTWQSYRHAINFGGWCGWQ